ncbi:MAG: YoaP domain-containing protein [Prevotella sp.]|nr:YoaP domain-containing protein [Prevotella sp.]
MFEGFPFKAIHLQGKEEVRNAPTPITTYKGKEKIKFFSFSSRLFVTLPLRGEVTRSRHKK